MGRNDLSTYEINSPKSCDRRTEPSTTLSHGRSGATHYQQGFPDGDRKSEGQLSLSAGPSWQSDMLIPSCGHFTDSLCTTLKSAVRHPPVTTSTLVELDLNWILHNMNLRSDINFENDLHFMPVKGARAERKRREAHEYWLALAAELQIHLHTGLGCTSTGGGERSSVVERFAPRIPQMFSDLRALLESLVSEKDLADIAEHFDPPFLMQQIDNGVLDIPRLAGWVASLLKSNCAPMRDEWADYMTQQIEEGARTSNMRLLVTGIERLFSFLEAMKLVTSSRDRFR